MLTKTLVQKLKVLQHAPSTPLRGLLSPRTTHLTIFNSVPVLEAQVEVSEQKPICLV